jgi:hypothetical protein
VLVTISGAQGVGDEPLWRRAGLWYIRERAGTAKIRSSLGKLPSRRFIEFDDSNSR